MGVTPTHSVPARLDRPRDAAGATGVARGRMLGGVVETVRQLAATGRGTDARTMQIGGIAVLLVGAIALAGWLTETRLLAAASDRFIPVAPNTAVAFLLLGTALWTLGGGSHAGRRAAQGLTAVALILAGARLLEYFAGVQLEVDHWLFAFPSETLGLAPVGRMAFFTALAFTIAGTAVIAATRQDTGRLSHDLARALGLITTVVGLVFVLGYVYGSPLLYGGRSIPMALPTAVGFTLLGLAISVPMMLRARAERLAAQEALRAARDELERKVAERTAELEAANEELQISVIELEERTEEVEGARRDAVAAEERYRSLVNGLPIGVVLMTVEGVQAANPSAEHILGMTAEQLRRCQAFDRAWRLVDEDGMPLPPEQTPLAVSLMKGTPQRQVVIGVHQPDGELVWIEVSSDPLFHDGSSTPYAAVASFVDVTEERRLREQLIQAQKMEAVGQLAGGIAHDFNNLLTAISSYAQLAIEQLPADSQPAEDLIEIRAAAERASALTRQLLAFSRKQILQPEVLDLNAVVDGVGKMLARLIGEDVDYSTTLAPDLWAVKADPGQVEQVLTNLVVNARDAMPDGGRLAVETCNTTLDANYAARVPNLEPGEYVQLSVSDTGVGMDRTTQERIFEPFFTTKAKGEGTGLGLSTVYGIVRQSCGHVAVYSEPGRGTTFRVYFPREREAAVAAPAAPKTEALPGGDETVLLVEDDPGVRAVTIRILEQLGYTVLPAPAPSAAEAIVAQHVGSIHLLLTDLVLPESSGRELAERLTAQRPDMRVLFMSGYTDDAVVRRGILTLDMNFLPKPFTAAALARTARRVLDGHPRSAEAPR